MYIDISHDTKIQNLLVICIFLNSKEKQNFQFSRDHHIHAPIIIKTLLEKDLVKKLNILFLWYLKLTWGSLEHLIITHLVFN
jgi:hypothetical protein